MATTLLRGSTQIMPNTISWDRMVAGAIVPSASLVDGANFLKKDGTVLMTAAFNLGGFLATNSSLTPVNASDLVPKAYVDALIGGWGGVHEVRLVSIVNIPTLSGLLAIDTITTTATDTVLLTAQTTASQNGPWVPASGAWTRPTWWAAASTIKDGHYFIVGPDGSANKNTKYFCATSSAITVDTTSVSFTLDAGGTSYTAGTGLSLAGSTFSVNYGTAAGTAAQGNDSRITGALQTTALGTGVQTALGVAVGSAGAPVLFNGAGGTPTSMTLTNATGLPTTALTGTLAAAQAPAFAGGDVTSTAGSLVLTVNHTAGSGFLKYTDFVFNETPTGAVNGVNATFTLANTPQVNSLELMLNGETLEPGAGNDYTISGTTITMLLIPTIGDKLRAACYLK